MGYCYDDYVALAADAEGMAVEARDEEHKATWLRIAAGYRDLARMAPVPRREREWRALTQDIQGLTPRSGS